MCSSRIGSRVETNFTSLPVVTLEAPMIRTGRWVLAPQPATSPKSIYFRKSSGKSVKLRRLPNVMNDIIVCTSGEDGLSCRTGKAPLLAIRMASMMNWLKVSSFHPWAMLSFQKSITRPQTGRSPFRSAYHASAEHTAPPEVPLTLTTSKSLPAPDSISAFKAPAVKAVWLPPPWQAIATLIRLIRRSRQPISQPPRTDRPAKRSPALICINIPPPNSPPPL
jgi:hypothetical protein